MAREIAEMEKPIAPQEPWFIEVISPSQEQPMKIRISKLLKVLGLVLTALLVVGIGAAAILWKKPAGKDPYAGSTFDPSSQLVLRDHNTIGVPADIIDVLGIKTGEAAKAKPRPLDMIGQTTPDIDRLVRIRQRFPAKVIEITQVTDHEPAAFGGKTLVRRIGVGDKVRKDQILAVVYSTDLGQQKSTLVDSLSQLRLDEDVLKEYEAASTKGALPERDLLNQRRMVEQDRIAADKAENTLRSWEVPDDEIETLKEESNKIIRPGAARNKEKFETWARMEVRAPFDGTIVEKNATVGDYVDPTQGPPPLFQVADRNLMTVLAYANEDDLPQLQNLPQPIHWKVRLMAEPDAPLLESPTGDPQGPTVERILPVVETNQHSPILKGTVKNPQGKYLANMAVKATIELPSPADWVQIPASALVEDGEKAFVFIQLDPQKLEYTQRQVAIARHYQDVAYVRSQLAADEPKQNANGQGTGPQSLLPGQRVVVSGVVELQAALEDLQTKAQTEAKQK